MGTGSTQTATIIAVLVELINLNQSERDFVNGCHLCNFLGKKKKANIQLSKYVP